MKDLIAMFFGEPKSKKLLTKYLVVQKNQQGSSRCTHCGQMRDIGNSLCLTQFDNKKEVEKYIDEDISKNDRKYIEIYQLTPAPKGLTSNKK